jgi:DNA-binding NarL/FixJ family response regulator
MATAKPIRIFIADDHSIFREGLKQILELEKDIKIVGEIAAGDGLVARLKSSSPEILLLDINLPGQDGIKLAETLSASPETENIKIIMLSMYDDQHHFIKSLLAGAVAYVVKTSNSADLLRTIRVVHKEGAAISRFLTPQLLQLVRQMSQENDRKKEIKDLTRKEIEIINLIAKGESNREIGKNIFMSEKTVKNHVHTIFEKLGAKNRTQAIVEAVHRGIISL